MTTLSFDGAVNVAVRIVREQYNDATLLCATGTPSTGSAENATDINQLCVTFATPNGTVLMNSTTWGSFPEPTFLNHPILGTQAIQWPVHFDLPEAVSLLRQAGYDQPFTLVTLRQPLYPGVTQPDFMFQLVDGTCISIGCLDHAIRAAGAAPVAVV